MPDLSATTFANLTEFSTAMFNASGAPTAIFMLVAAAMVLMLMVGGIRAAR